MTVDCLYVGVTGHRRFDQENDAKFFAAVDAKLEQLLEVKPSSKHILVTGLASGADTLVAERAISFGWSILAALAKPVDDFYNDFSSDFERRRLDSLIAASEEVQILSGSIANDPQCYVDVGDFIIGMSEYLIAVWDRDAQNCPPGGTSWVVQRFLKKSASNAARLEIIGVTR